MHHRKYWTQFKMKPKFVIFYFFFRNLDQPRTNIYNIGLQFHKLDILSRYSTERMAVWCCLLLVWSMTPLCREFELLMCGFVLGGNICNGPLSEVRYWASPNKFRSNATVEGLAFLFLYTVLLNSPGNSTTF